MAESRALHGALRCGRAKALAHAGSLAVSRPDVTGAAAILLFEDLRTENLLGLGTMAVACSCQSSEQPVGVVPIHGLGNSCRQRRPS